MRDYIGKVTLVPNLSYLFPAGTCDLQFNNRNGYIIQTSYIITNYN